MLTLRYRDVKASCAKQLGLCVDDSENRVLDYVNRSIERLLYGGKWKGTVQTFRFCVNSSACVVWPREIEALEAVAVDLVPYDIRSAWYEFAENGIGVIDSTCDICKTLVDRGEVCAFDEVTGSNKKLAVFADRTEGSGKYINLQFYDENGQWVLSEFDGAVIDGEKLQIPTTAGTYVYTSKTCKAGGLLRVQKDATLGVIRLYSYDTTTAELKPLAYYQPDEEVPAYRRSLIPALNNGSCEQTTVSLVAKLRFIPAVNDDSFLMISHREAIRLACHAIKLEEDNLEADANAKWAKAFGLLDSQLRHYLGAGEQNVFQMAPPSLYGPGVPCVQ